MLISFCVFDCLILFQVEEIKGKTLRRQKVEHLLNVLPQRGSHAYVVFRDSLKESYQHLYDMLLCEEKCK